MSFSYWEQSTFIKSPDVIIIGSGIVGLNAAIALKQKSPSLHVIIIERGMLPYGASTRNAGFACYGSMSELLSDLESSSEEKVFQLVEKRWNGLQRLRKIVGDNKMHFEPLGGFEIFTASEESLYQNCHASIAYMNKHIDAVTGLSHTYRNADEKIKTFGFRNVTHLIENTGEGQLDTGLMMKTLLDVAGNLGVQILSGVNVSQFDQRDDLIELRMNDGQSERTIKCRRIIICVNGFAKKFLPDLDVTAARAQVLVTSPLKNLKVKGSFHYDRGYYYFRNVDDRILFGGGRNLDFEGETSEEMILTSNIQSTLEEILKSVILPDTEFTIDMRWSGIMGLGSEKSPIIKETAPNIFCAVRLGGMGVAIGSLVAQEVAELVLETL